MVVVGAADFHDAKAFVLRRQLRLDIAAFTGLALSSSHAAGVIERFGIDGARSALRELATPHRVDEDHVLFGYVFQCFTAPRCVTRTKGKFPSQLAASSCSRHPRRPKWGKPSTMAGCVPFVTRPTRTTGSPSVDMAQDLWIHGST
jgi:hypothetical protein